MKKHNYELQVLVNGRPIREYYENSRTFVEARKTVEYELKFKNNTWQRVLAVFSVDGINVIDGEKCQDSGYVVGPWQSITVKGYRIDNDSVANFKFGEAGASYASLMENDNDVYEAMDNPSQNNGVVGVRVWSEKEWPVIKPLMNNPMRYKKGAGDEYFYTDAVGKYWDSHTTCDSTVNATYSSFAPQVGGCCAETPPADFTIGTEWGEEQRDRVDTTSFEKGALLDTLLIYYMDRVNLENAGIDLKKKPSIAMPSAFGEFCRRPSNWRG